MIWRKVPIELEDLECTENGDFKYKGRLKKVIYPNTVRGQKATAKIVLRKDKKTCYYQASKLVAMTWIAKYSDDNYIIYKDGDCHNIKASNLILGDKKDYTDYRLRNAVHKSDDMQTRIAKLENVIKESSLTLHYFKTKDFDPINKHIQQYLYECLFDYCLNTLHLGRSTAMEIVPDCIARMYECILNGMCLYNYERYCKKLLLNYKKKGDFGLTGLVPKPIKIEVHKLNLDCLCERFNVVKNKH